MPRIAVALQSDFADWEPALLMAAARYYLGCEVLTASPDGQPVVSMGGLKVKEELKAVSEACARQDFILEPTGGIDLENFEEIMHIILDAGVPKVIPHVYSSIIDKATGNTRIEDVERLLAMVKAMV